MVAGGRRSDAVPALPDPERAGAGRVHAADGDLRAGAHRGSLADPDPWQGFQRLVETVCELQREERGFPAAFVAACPDSTAEHAQSRERAERDLTTPVRRAQASGALRADFQPSDLAVILLAHCGLVTALPDDSAASRRLVAYLLQSFRADTANVPLPPPASLSLRSLPLTADSPQERRPPGLDVKRHLPWGTSSVA